MIPNEETRDPGDLTPYVRQLLEKYGKTAPPAWRVWQSPPPEEGPLTLVPGCGLPAEPAGTVLPLLPWRQERRFQELKKMVEMQTLESLSLCRFSCQTDGRSMNLEAVLYREFDLAEWLANSWIESLTASLQGGRWAHVILRLASGVVCGVEAGATLPAGTDVLDRHELIARRGVGCDRLVDSQVPQHSVYTFTADGVCQYTDTDAELFGLSQDAITLARAACDALVNPGQFPTLRQRHRRLRALVHLAFDSDRRGQRLTTEGVQP